ncbi:6-phosphofructokinase [Syntrophomonas palmitatica]|uniref:6-phosphofructokinase n=1 Tax=Syntrophomonas palmitatica TaxID=402877 RepID=UPI000A4A3D05|nr:6-phosphofructokinase [Syntrophomonas palmitatica]
MKEINQIGLITGGGDCPGLNSVIRAVTKSAILNYGLEVIGFLDGFKGLVEDNYIQLDLRRVSGISHIGGTILGTTNRDNPFNYYTDIAGQPQSSDQSERAMNNMRNLGLDGLIVIGGDGSLHIANQFAQKGVKVVGVPKTIDNDLAATDVTFGFNTAVDTASDALDKLHTTAESHHRVMILEVMGRYAGWIALHAGLSGSADVILIPEIPYNIDAVVAKITQRYRQGKKFSIIVVAEGAAPENGEMVVQNLVPTSHDPIRLGGIGQKVAEEIGGRLSQIEIRVTVLGHLQRGGSPIPYDRILATRYGVAAVDALMAGKYGTMVSLRGNEIINVPIVEAIKDLRKVDPNGSMIRVARSVGVSFGDR